MPSSPSWKIAEPDVETVLATHAEPLEQLAAATIPAIVLRGAFPRSACEQLVDRLIAQDLLYDPRVPVPPKFIEAAIPEGYYREGRGGADTFAWQEKLAAGKRRIDIGTSLGYRGSEPDVFFAHARETEATFARLFPDETENPIRVLYSTLEKLSRTKRVVTAYEPDGRRYGPAIIRAHYGGYTYQPHFDSVRLREKRGDFAVHAFEHQFAGVMVLQNTQLGDRTAQCILHHCLWQEEVDPHLRAGTFHDYARERGIGQIEVVLEPGDLYFFNTRLIHEVPGIAGLLPRIVLATFIGYSSDRDEVFVWS